MELVIRMKTVTRALLFLVALILWLVVLAFLNGEYLFVDDLVIVLAAPLLAAGTAVGAAIALKS